MIDASQRLNGFIRAFEQGKPAFGAFVPTEIDAAIAFGGAKYDGIIFETEHNTWDARALRTAMQFLLQRRLIAQSGSLAPSVTPIVRIPPNGSEMNQWFAKQALDLGAYGIVWPHISDVAQARNAVSACRYPSLPGRPLHEPVGQRGDGPTSAVRYWGLSQQDYYDRADVWPLNPRGEILVILMIEDTKGIANLDDILKQVPGIGAVLIGEGDLSQELGYPRQYEHPVVVDAMASIVATCKAHNVPVGHPHVDGKNIERVLEQGYRLLLASPNRSYATLEKGMSLSGRS